MRTSLARWTWIGAALLLAACRGTPARDASSAAAFEQGAPVEAGATGWSNEDVVAGHETPAPFATPAPAEAPPGMTSPVAAPAAPDALLGTAPVGPAPEALSRTPALRTVAPPALPGAAPASLPAPLRELRAALDDARTATSDQSLTTGGEQPLDVLVGMTRDGIRDALGEPSTCTDVVWFDAAGRGHPVAPCSSHADWFYSFYHLPEGWVGGGPELLLQFDADGSCTAAAWHYTQ
ncbi:MAG: hypothetical protein HY905_23155 [Deltaproteobacteria bacterium]|nr:hypothetical protein [Deltaproteobacteria bacterium]